MARLNPHSEYPSEPCATCGMTRPHKITIELLTESEQEANQKFSREPYRIAECRICGTATKLRLNNA